MIALRGLARVRALGVLWDHEELRRAWTEEMSKKRVEAVAYLRTSSATNVGPDKDSDKRQRDAIRAYAQRAGYELVAEFYDAAVSGADPIEGRPGSGELAKAGHVNERGRPFHHKSVRAMLDA